MTLKSYKGNHVCHLNLDRSEMFYYPGENLCMKLIGYIGILFMISEKNPSCKKYIRSRAYIIYEKRRHIRHYKCRIHPFSLFSFFWEIFMILTSMIGLVYIPYHGAFEIPVKTKNWIWIKNVLILCTYLDILVNFSTGYLDLNENYVELRFKPILRRYVKCGTFLPDLISSIPTDVFFLSDGDVTVFSEICALVYFFRVFSVSKYFGNLARAFDVNRHVYEFVETISWLLLLLHWQGCIFWLVPIASVSMGKPMRPKNESWINILNLWDPSKRHVRYHQSFYRSVVTFTRSGFSKAEPRTREGQYTVIVSQVICTFALCILVASMMQLFKGANSSKLKYQQNVMRLNEYMKHKQLPDHIQRRLNTYYESKYSKHYFRETEILSHFSDQMRQEVRMFSCRKLVENVYFFHDLPVSMLVRIVTLLKSEIILTNDVVVAANQIGNCMYFIASGTVAVYTASGKEVCHLESGSHFGEIALVMPDSRRVATVVAVEVCKLYRLERADFIRTIHPYPLLWDRIKKIAYERVERTAMLNVQ